jgi:heme/copper-type cytochrome/quinol oxidase subunit 2
MKGFVVIESRASFDAWLAAQAAENEEEDEWDEEG